MHHRRYSVFPAAAAVVSLASLAVVPAGGGGPPDFGQPLPRLTAGELSRFQAGKTEFEEIETVADGLGPVFNDASCANCHLSPAVGGGSARLETRFGTLTPAGQFDPMTAWGGPLIQSQGIGGPFGSCSYSGEVVPPEATIVAQRRTTPLFGLGLVDHVPDATFHWIAKVQAFDPDQIAGIVSMVIEPTTGRPVVGKFGWKAQNPSLHVFAGDAYLNEMGITNPMFPDENCPQGDCASLSCNPMSQLNDDGSGVQAFTDFMEMLAPPPRGAISVSAVYGEHLFHQIGCASCHVATLRTGPDPSAAFDRVTFYPYSDFLLHDMGSLGDGITQNQATGQLMRTAPLWGLRAQTVLLHDGRASTVEAAIEAHDGQGKKSRDRFHKLSSWQKTQLLAFLHSL